jgi:hypothetical protein
MRQRQQDASDDDRRAGAQEKSVRERAEQKTIEARRGDRRAGPSMPARIPGEAAVEGDRLRVRERRRNDVMISAERAKILDAPQI